MVRRKSSKIYKNLQALSLPPQYNYAHCHPSKTPNTKHLAAQHPQRSPQLLPRLLRILIIQRGDSEATVLLRPRNHLRRQLDGDRGHGRVEDVHRRRRRDRDDGGWRNRDDRRGGRCDGDDGRRCDRCWRRDDGRGRRRDVCVRREWPRGRTWWGVRCTRRRWYRRMAGRACLV